MQDISDAEPAKGNAVWALAVAIIVALIWAFASLPGEIRDIAPWLTGNGPEGQQLAKAYGTIEGHGLFISAVVWAVMYFAIVRRRAQQRGLLYFLIIWGVVTAASFAVILFAKSQAESRARDRVVQMKTAVSQLASSFSAIKNGGNANAINLRTKAQGEAGVLEQTTKQFLATVLTDRQNYRAAIKALDYPQFLTPSALAADRGLLVTRAKLRRARVLVKTYQALNEQRFTDFREAIAKAPLNDVLKRQTLAGIDQTSAPSKAARDRLWALDDSTFAEFEKIAALLAHPGGPWVVSGRQIRFTTQADLNAYNAHIRNLTAMAEEEKALQQNMQQTANSSIEAMKRDAQ